MTGKRGRRTASGVFVLESFRDNLTIDRYDPVFAGMRASKLKHLCSENSEDAITWNVFRTLRQFSPEHWLPVLASAAFGPSVSMDSAGATVDLWRMVSPPLSLVREADEGQSEIDILIESPHWVWFIEAKYKSDISTGTTTRPDRDQVIRNIDVGSFYAGVRDFYFSLLVLSAKRTCKGLASIEEHGDSARIRAALPHRTDGLDNYRGSGVLTWADAATALKRCATGEPGPLADVLVDRALAWLGEHGIHPAGA